MGSWFSSGTFGRVYTAGELQTLYPDEATFNTAAGQRSGADVRRAFVARQVGDKQASLGVLMLVYFMLSLFIYLGVSVVPNYAQIDDQMGVLSVPHSIWGIWPMITVVVYAWTFFFGAYFTVARVVMGARGFFAVLLIGILAHIAHLVLAIIELSQCTSLLCTNANSTVGKGFLIGLIVVLGVFIVWLIIVWLVASSFIKLLTEGLQAGWVPGAGPATRLQANRTLAAASGDFQLTTPLMSDTAPNGATGFVDENGLADEEGGDEAVGGRYRGSVTHYWKDK